MAFRRHRSVAILEQPGKEQELGIGRLKRVGLLYGVVVLQSTGLGAVTSYGELDHGPDSSGADLNARLSRSVTQSLSSDLRRARPSSRPGRRRPPAHHQTLGAAWLTPAPCPPLLPWLLLSLRPFSRISPSDNNTQFSHSFAPSLPIRATPSHDRPQDIADFLPIDEPPRNSSCSYRICLRRALTTCVLCLLVLPASDSNHLSLPRCPTDRDPVVTATSFLPPSQLSRRSASSRAAAHHHGYKHGGRRQGACRCVARS